MDDSVEPSVLKEISRENPYVEWGVLLRSDKQGTPRYASDALLQELGGLGVHLAAHLCGDYCEEALRGRYDAVERLLRLGFKRVQMNPTRANNVILQPEDMAEHTENARRLIERFPQAEFILQWNEETRALWAPLLDASPPNLSLLFDASCGTGVAITAPPAPREGVRCGYAGGLGPSTLGPILQQLEEATGDAVVWVDMESSLRRVSGDADTFSIDACRACIAVVKASPVVTIAAEEHRNW